MMLMHNARRFMMPSKTLGRYVMKLYMKSFLGMLIGLVSVLQLLDLLANMDAVMSGVGATAGAAVDYVLLRLPQMMSEFIPFSALLATLFTLAALNQNSEIIIMKASGLSAHRILFPLGVPCLLIAGLHFTFNETIVTQSTAKLNYWADNDYAAGLPPPPEYAKDARLIDGNTLVIAENITRSGTIVLLDKVSLYERDDIGLPISLVRANFASYIDEKWTLFEVRHFNPITHELSVVESLPWHIDATPDSFLASTIKPDHVTSVKLWSAISELQKEGRPVDTLLASYYQKFFAPMATLLMPLLGAIAGFGVHRAGSLLVRIVMGMALGFSFFVADNFMLAMGEFGVAPPLMAAGAPFLLFLTVGFTVLFFTEE